MYSHGSPVMCSSGAKRKGLHTPEVSHKGMVAVLFLKNVSHSKPFDACSHARKSQLDVGIKVPQRS